MSFALKVMVGVTMLSGFCAPDRCYVASSRFHQLDPVIAELVVFEQTHGRFPETLEQLFPDGFPNGIVPDNADTGSYRFPEERGGFSRFYYGPEEGMLGRPSLAQTTDAAVAVHFSYVGGGLLAGMNDCFWTSSDRVWQCSGLI